MPEEKIPSEDGVRSELLRGEIIAIEETRICIRLESGGFGYVASPERSDADALEIGCRATFRVVTTGSSGVPDLAFAEAASDSAVVEPFDRDVVRLHNALANHHPTNTTRPAEPAPEVHLGEEQIRAWIDKVDETVGRLRRHRAKRLNEEFTPDAH